MSTPLYWRQFTRDGSPDVDTQADADFLVANFTDHFGQWLQEGENGLDRSFDALVMPYWTGSQQSPAQYKVSTFMVADGSFIKAEETPDWSWFNPHIRVVTLVCQAGKSFFASNPGQWTLCIVGSRFLYSEDRNESFLQVASWNGSEFRFYQNDLVNGTGSASFWNYFGKSMDAFGASEYLGPFNGHVNGACIMKELHRPWLHWYSLSGPPFQACFTADDVATFGKAPYITEPGMGLLSSVNHNPNELETAVRSGISNWFSKRLRNDFIDTTHSPSKPLQSPAHIPRWTAHMFLTTTINIGAAVSTGSPGVYALPYDHFYDNELLQNFDLIPSDLKTDATFNQSDCIAAANNLGLSLIQELDPYKQPPTKPDFTLPWQSLGGDRRAAGDYSDVGYKIALAGEGTSPFNFLHASYEDAQGVVKSQRIVKADEKQPKQPSFIGLFSKHTFYAIMMLDFWNPIYSWKRGILMGYVPQTTKFNGKSYDLEPNFIANVKKSPKASEPESPEYQFLQLLNKTLEDFQQMIRDYLTAVASRVKNDPVNALQDYLLLAESRRRIYRPLPLDEFGYTLPFATKVPFTPGKGLLEMTPQGTIQVMDQRGQDFLNAWTISLAEPDPHVVPTAEAKNHTTEPGAPPVAITALPRPATLAIRCQSLTSQVSSSPSSLATRRSRRSGGGCPFRNQSVAKAPSESSAQQGGTGAAGIPLYRASSSQPPNWADDILPILTAPYWVSGDPERTGRYWKEEMAKFGPWDLSDYSDVASKAVSIYRHVLTKSMPITDNPQNYWPDEAVEKFRAWVNAGCPRDSSASQVNPPKEEVLPSPGAEVSGHDLMVRRDIMSLTREELALYQSRLDDVLHSQSLESKWQELGILHAEWCLHYQEATFFWHRAHLRYMERLIGHPIPYWNGFATAAADPTSPYAGIPPVFLEETYVHPVDGTTRKNPLKYSLALNGKSKDGTSRYPVRRPVLVEGHRSSPEWVGQIRYLDKYHKQIIASLQTSTYSSPGGTAEGDGLPWANITSFSDDQPDSLYPYRTDFDGLFEQVHDNFHGWVGPDMADNTYTAFDPIFYSYHANMDRLLSIYLDTHAGRLQFTSDFPLQPFVMGGGPTAPGQQQQQQGGQVTVDYEEPRRWAFATIGDMARRSAALGYVYAPPASPDAWAPAVSPALAAHRGSVRPAGGRALTLWRDVVSAAAAARRNGVQGKAAAERKKVPYVLFGGVGCTDESYSIEVFGPGEGELPGSGGEGSAVMAPQHEEYIGQVTRLGMGPGVDGKGGRNAGRCRRPEATRMLRVDDPRIAANLEKDPGVRLVVTRLHDGQVLGEEDYKGLSGFEPRVVWLTEE